MSITPALSQTLSQGVYYIYPPYCDNRGVMNCYNRCALSVDYLEEKTCDKL